MKAVFFADLIVMRRYLAQLFGTCAFIAVFIAIVTQSAVPVGACLAAPMKAVFFADLIVMRRYLAQLFGTCAFIAVFIAIVTQSAVPVGACLAAMIPMMFLLSIVAYDEMNSWESFRLVLPVSRNGVVMGRYASFLLMVAVSMVVGGVLMCLLLACATALAPSFEIAKTIASGGVDLAMVFGSVLMAAAFVIVLAALSLPLIMRSGMTRAARFLPVVMVLIFVGGGFVFGEDGPLSNVGEALCRRGLRLRRGRSAVERGGSVVRLD